MKTLYEYIPLQNNCRYFVKYISTIKYNRGFKSKKEIKLWYDEMFLKKKMEWVSGNVFKLYDFNICMLVNRKGEFMK